MRTASPCVVEGGIFSDNRGTIRHANDFKFPDIKRFYIIESPSGTVRAWQGHKIESKSFFAVKGMFRLCAVRVDDWKSPSDNLSVQEYLLEDTYSRVLCLPPGYANGIQTIKENSILLVFSNLELEDSTRDTYRFDSTLWFDWKKPALPT